ncbi:hypothetical protein DSO57_1033342 [Entomophthora muscae]|uniref:Uncharacterized protein n=2 Tax=Entomophthora muscae TaxID=34485 RepID=A0ACC2S2B5_9FUNG|nr:hypothetical protein DSO57_1033342 [Entomophthora muscae]
MSLVKFDNTLDNFEDQDLQYLPHINPRVFYDIEADGKKLGRVVFELFMDEVPRIAQDIRALFTGERGIGKHSGIPLHLRGTMFNQVIKGMSIRLDLIQEGITISEKELIHEGYFRRRHTAPWLLSFGDRSTSSGGQPQLLATLRPTPHLDTRHVVVGQVVRGFDILQMIEVSPVDNQDRPLAHLSVSHCGELELRIPHNVIIKGLEEPKHSFGSRSSSVSSITSSDSESSGSRRRTSSSRKSKKKSKSSKEKRSSRSKSKKEKYQRRSSRSRSPESRSKRH